MNPQPDYLPCISGQTVFLCFALISSMKWGGRLLPIAISVDENQIPFASFANQSPNECNIVGRSLEFEALGKRVTIRTNAASMPEAWSPCLYAFSNTTWAAYSDGLRSVTQNPTHEDSRPWNSDCP